MNPIFEVLLRPTEVFKSIDNLFEDELNANSNIIIAAFGSFTGLYACYLEYSHIERIALGYWLIPFCLFMILISSGLCLLLYNYFIAYILYWFGKLLGSKGIVADTRASISYSLAPGFLSLLFLWAIRYFSSPFIEPNILLWTLRITSLTFWIWMMTILVIGLMTLNKYGFWKAVLNVLPLIAIGFSFLLIKKILT